jgi:hypothetical protein
VLRGDGEARGRIAGEWWFYWSREKGERGSALCEFERGPAPAMVAIDGPESCLSSAGGWGDAGEMGEASGAEK